jgi:hypothetical protein
MFRRPTYAEAFISPVPNDEGIAKNIIHPKVEKSSNNEAKECGTILIEDECMINALILELARLTLNQG